MKKDEKKKVEEKSTRESVENGQKAIDMDLELKKTKDSKAKEKEQKDAKSWRNEG